MFRYPRTDTALLSTVVVVLIFSVLLSLINREYFGKSFAIEDGPVEYATAILLFVSSIILAKNAFNLQPDTTFLRAATLVYALAFFLAAGEEISWGQRIFGWESSEYFQANNYQDETNFHNLVIGDVHLAKIVFGHGLSIVVFFYLVILPFVNSATGLVSRILNKVAFPLPSKRHAILAFVATLAIVAIDASRKWEVYEMVFGLLTLSIFLNPANKIYRAGTAADS